MVDTGNEIFDDSGNFKKEIIPTLVGQLIQESFVTGILYINLTTEIGSNDSNRSVSMLYGHRMLKTKGSIFAELSESINLEKLSKQVSQLIEVATVQLNDLNSSELSTSMIGLSASIQDALGKVLDNLEIEKKSRTGYSIGIGYPPDWGEHTLNIYKGDMTVLEPNVCFHMIAVMQFGDWGVEASEAIRVTENGSELFCNFPKELHIKS